MLPPSTQYIYEKPKISLLVSDESKGKGKKVCRRVENKSCEVVVWEGKLSVYKLIWGLFNLKAIQSMYIYKYIFVCRVKLIKRFFYRRCCRKIKIFAWYAGAKYQRQCEKIFSPWQMWMKFVNINILFKRQDLHQELRRRRLRNRLIEWSYFSSNSNKNFHRRWERKKCVTTCWMMVVEEKKSWKLNWNGKRRENYEGRRGKVVKLNLA